MHLVGNPRQSVRPSAYFWFRHPITEQGSARRHSESGESGTFPDGPRFADRMTQLKLLARSFGTPS